MTIRSILFLLAGVLVLMPSGLRAQNSWQWQNPLPQGNNLECVDAVGPNIVYAVGGAATLLKSTNSGNSWDVRQILDNTQVTLHAVHFPTPSVGWIAGSNGVIQNTSDAGAHWFARATPDPARVYHALASTGPNNGYAVGDNGTILRTRDGGVSWEQVTSNTAQDLYGISLPTPVIGYAVGDNGTILKTSDGGNNWINIPEPTLFRDYKAVCFLNQDVGWVAGVGGTLLSTTDGGGTWLRQFSGTASTLTAITFTTPNLGYAVGGRILLQTTNGGFSWTPSVLTEVNTITSIGFADSSIGWVVGHNGEIQKTLNKGQNWARFAQNTTFDLFGASFTSETRGWAVGERGTIMHTPDGGATWFNDFSPVTAALRSVHMLASDRGWAVGDAGTILRTLDGITWNQIPADSQKALYAVNFSDLNNGWAVGARGTMLGTTDGGATWNAAPRPATDSLLTMSSVFFLDNARGWVTANYGLSNDSTLILRTVDGGLNWDTLRSENRALLAIQFLNADTGYAVGKFHYIIKTTNGGQTWRPLINPVRSVQHFVALRFLSTTVGYVVGTGGNIIRTLNGGNTWTLEPTGTSRSFSAVAFASADKGWVVGVGGTIMNTVDGGGPEPPPEPPPPTSGTNNHVLQGQPSPFLPLVNGVTYLPFRLSGQSDVKIRIFDVMGRLIRVIDAGVYTAGLHDSNSDAPAWNGVDDLGYAVPSGVYYFMVFTSEYVETQRLVLLR